MATEVLMHTCHLPARYDQECKKVTVFRFIVVSCKVKKSYLIDIVHYMQKARRGFTLVLLQPPLSSMASQGDSMPNHRYHEFHNTAASLSPRNPPGEDHHLVRQFHGPGVERQMNHREDQGFIYGSTQLYPREGDRRRRGLSEKMCTT